MTRLYLSGPMSGYPDHNFPAFNAAADRLRVAGYDVFSPADRGVVDGWTWADYLKEDLVELVKCDGVALLPSWWGSKGSRLEVRLASDLGFRIKGVGTWLAVTR